MIAQMVVLMAILLQQKVKATKGKHLEYKWEGLLCSSYFITNIRRGIKKSKQ
jgi:hypothetical protein